jgi:hypothetical protein
MSDQLFVPADFVIADGLTAEEFRLEPLGPQHNAADYAAWTASISHIQATPGFAGRGWPHPMSLAENLRDLERHARDFADRRGFTYTVLSTGTGEVIGCVYIYPPRSDGEGSVSAGDLWLPGRPRACTTRCKDPSPVLPAGSRSRGQSAPARHNSLLCVARAADLTHWRHRQIGGTARSHRQHRCDAR